MNELAYLGLAAVISVLGSAGLWYKQRRPSGIDAGVQDFTKGLRALGESAREGRSSV